MVVEAPSDLEAVKEAAQILRATERARLWARTFDAVFERTCDFETSERAAKGAVALYLEELSK